MVLPLLRMKCPVVDRTHQLAFSKLRGIRPGAVFANADSSAHLLAEISDPPVSIVRAGAIPSRINIPRSRIRDFVFGSSVLAERGRNRWASRIDLLGEFFEIVNDRHRWSRGHRPAVEFVEDSPHGDRRVIIVLVNHLLQLLASVGEEPGRGAHGIDEGDFLPSDDPEAVAEVVEVFRLLIVRKPDRVGSHFANERVVFVVVGMGQRPAFASAFLVPVHPVQRVGLAIQQKAFFLVDRHCAKPQRLRHLIEQFPCAAQANRRRVKIRISSSPPKAWSRDFDCCGVFTQSRLGEAFGFPHNHRTFGVLDFDLECDVLQVLTLTRKERLHFDLGLFLAHFSKGQKYPRRSEEYRRDADLARAENFHGPVNAAKDRKIPRDRCNIELPRVVHPNPHGIFPVKF